MNILFTWRARIRIQLQQPTPCIICIHACIYGYLYKFEGKYYVACVCVCVFGSVARLPFFICQMQINEIISVIFHQQTTIFIEMPAICCFGSTIIIRASQGCTLYIVHSETQMKFILSCCCCWDGDENGITITLMFHCI